MVWQLFTSKSRLITGSILFLSLVLLPLFTRAELSASDNLWNLSLADLLKVKTTSIATGTQTPLDKAASTVTVISSEDIAAMGATDLDQVLETVPGLHVGRSDQAFYPKFNIRGITSTPNAQTLMLINGIPITSLFQGNRSNVWGGMPIKSISRIEVIRGPGSALYGADAFSGVINVITKNRENIAGTLVGIRAGSFNTQSIWLEHGETYNNLDLAFTLEIESTDGFKEKIDQDAQTGFDAMFAPPPASAPAVSLAPGSVNTMKDMVESRLDLSLGNNRLRTGYQGRYNIGTGPGIGQAIDNHGRFASQRFNADYTYSQNQLTENWGLESRISYYHGTQEVEENVVIFPPGAFAGAFPNGFIGNPEFKEENARLDISSIYRGFNQHLLRLGVGYYWGDIYEVKESKNFNPDFSPRAGLEDVSDTPEVYLPEKGRTNYHGFIQDEWQISSTLQLISGLRYDHYSDFGDTTNPRLALVWAATDNITGKLLYGRAFRAPSIAELFVTSNPIQLGNPDLRPETIDTLELALSHQLSAQYSYTSNLYYYEINDYIVFPGAGEIAQNVGKRSGYGVELEIEMLPLDNLQLRLNYAYQKSEDRTTHADIGDAPNHQIYLRSDWTFLPSWHLDTQINWIGEQKRVEGDVRAPVEAYTTVDLTLRKQKLFTNKLNLKLSVHNLFDEAVIEASPGPVAAIPGDFPMAGRSVYAELEYIF